MSFNTIYCCNPFKKVAHVRNARGLRKVQQWMTGISNNISISNKICDICRRELYKLKGSVNSNIQSMNEPENETSDSESEASVSGDVRIDAPTPEAGPSDKIIPISQARMDKIVAELNLSQREAEKLALLLNEGNNLEPNVKVTGYRRRQLPFQRYFTLKDEDRSSSDTDSEQVGEPPRKKVKGANKRK